MLIPIGVQDDMAGAMSSIDGVLAEFQTPILPKIDAVSTREGLIYLHQLVGGNAVFVALSLGEGRNVHLALIMTDEEYRSQTGFAFLPTHNPGDYPKIMGDAQDQALGTEKF